MCVTCRSADGHVGRFQVTQGGWAERIQVHTWGHLVSPFPARQGRTRLPRALGTSGRDRGPSSQTEGEGPSRVPGGTLLAFKDGKGLSKPF